MSGKKKKYNSRFPPARIKKIMQKDEEVGKVAVAVPVIISRALELFVESLLTRTGEITAEKRARTLTPSHLKKCVASEKRYDFLSELFINVADVTAENCDGDSEPNTPTVVFNPPNFTISQDEVLASESAPGRGIRGRGRGRGTGTRSRGRGRGVITCSSSQESTVSKPRGRPKKLDTERPTVIDLESDEEDTLDIDCDSEQSSEDELMITGECMNDTNEPRTPISSNEKSVISKNGSATSVDNGKISWSPAPLGISVTAPKVPGFQIVIPSIPTVNTPSIALTPNVQDTSSPIGQEAPSEPVGVRVPVITSLEDVKAKQKDKIKIKTSFPTLEVDEDYDT